MPDSDENTPLPPNDIQTAESRMRRALGLQGPGRQPPQQRADQARPRHRFVQDGGVPVVVLHSRGDADPTTPFKTRVSELDAALDAERAAHGATRRALQEMQANVQALQTRLAHTELAHSEAVAVERRARKEAEDSLQALMLPVAQQAELPVATPASIPPANSAASSKPTVRKVPRAPRTPKLTEAQPVKWWLPSFREKKRQ